VERRFERAPDLEGTALQRFQYDGLSRLTFALDGNDPVDPVDDAVVVRTWDSLGNLLLESTDGFTVASEYDIASRRVAIEYPDGRRLETPRDAAGRAIRLEDATGLYATYRHFGSGLLLEKRLPQSLVLSHLKAGDDGILRKVGYGTLGEPTEVSYLDAVGGVLRGYEYGRDRSGYALYERPLHTFGGVVTGIGSVWRYDSIYRISLFLPDVFDPRVPPDDPVEKLAFYPDGNHSWRFLLVNQGTRRLEVNPRSAYTKSGDETFEHDSSGNLRTAGPLLFTYDPLGRLVRVERSGAVVARYRYDALGCEDPEEFSGRGRRAAKEVLRPVEGQPAGLVRLVHDGERLLEERGADGALRRQYLYEDGGRVAALLVRGSASPPTAYSALHDGFGSTVALVGPDGAIEESARFAFCGVPQLRNSFGSVVPFPPLGNALLFGGNPYEHELGLYAVGARHFDPNLGRFLAAGGSLLPRAPLMLNGYLAPGFPGLEGEVTGRGGPRRNAPYLDPFRVRIPERSTALPREIAPLVPQP
jgi:YD repeat-containing protein